jgi:hypothetical protein
LGPRSADTPGAEKKIPASQQISGKTFLARLFQKKKTEGKRLRPGTTGD